MIYIISGYILITIIIAIFKKVDGYHSFINGIKDGCNVVLNMFPSLLAFVLIIECISSCGIIKDIMKITNHSWIIQIIMQMIVRPFSSGSSMSMMLNIYDMYGVDSIPSLFSTFIHSSCDTLFYMITLYFSSFSIVLNNFINHYYIFFNYFYHFLVFLRLL